MHPIEKISDDLLQPVAEFMHESAKKHAAQSNGLLTVLEPDTSTHEHQSLLQPIVRSQGELAEIEDLNPIANAIRPSYQQVFETIAHHDADMPEDQRSLTLVGEVLESQQNVVFGYDHGEDVITFILNAAASTNVLRARGYTFRPAVVASKMIDFLAIDLTNFGELEPAVRRLLLKADVEIEPSGLVHARNILSRVFSVQYLTIPNSQTTEDFRRRNQIVVEKYNGFVRSKIADDMRPARFTKDKPALFLHVATPGSLNYPLDVKTFHQLKRRGLYEFETAHDHSTFEVGAVEVIGGASNGLVSMFHRALTYAVVAKMHTKPPFFAIDKAHIALTDADAVRELGRKQAQLLDEAEPDIAHVYDVKRNLPLIR